MAVTSSGQITIDDLRREFRHGMPSATSNYSSGKISNADLYTLVQENYWARPSDDTTDIGMNHFYGATGTSGYFIPGRRGTDVYMYGWKEYGGGAFVDPEAGDTISDLGSATTSTRQRFFHRFYVTGIIIADYKFNDDDNGIKLTVWGVNNTSYTNSRAPRSIEFRAGKTGSSWTLLSSNLYSQTAMSQPGSSGDYDYYTNKWQYTWEENNSNNAAALTNIRNLFQSAYEQNERIYWRTY